MSPAHGWYKQQSSSTGKELLESPGKAEHPEDQTWDCAFRAPLASCMDVVIYHPVYGQEGSLALMTMTCALKLGNCHLMRAHMLLYYSPSNSREVASPHGFPRNRFSPAAQSSASGSACRQLVCMKTPSTGSVPKSLKCLSLSSEDSWEESSASHWAFAGNSNSRGPVHNSAAYRVTTGKGFCGLASEVRICLERFLNYVDKMEAINCWKWRHLQNRPDKAKQSFFLSPLTSIPASACQAEMNISEVRSHAWIWLTNCQSHSVKVPQTLNLKSIPFSLPKSCLFTSTVNHSYFSHHVSWHEPHLGSISRLPLTASIPLGLSYYLPLVRGCPHTGTFTSLQIYPVFLDEAVCWLKRLPLTSTQPLLHAKGPVPLLCNLSIWSSDRKKRDICYFLSTQETTSPSMGQWLDRNNIQSLSYS